MALIGVTGGIAAGKSEFTRGLSTALGAPSIDTDVLAREFVSTDPAVAAEVRRIFGESVCDGGEGIDRAALRSLVFSDAKSRRALEAILHPRIREAWVRWAQEHRASSAILLVEIPLLYETGAAALFNRVIAVGCSRGEQVRRIVKARRLTRETAESIIDSQWTVEDKFKQADTVIWNERSRAALQAQTALCACQLTYLFCP